MTKSVQKNKGKGRKVEPPAPPPAVIAKNLRAAFVKRKVLEWYEENVADLSEGDEEDENPLKVIPGEHDGWDEGFYDELGRAFGPAALEGSEDLLEATIGDIIKLIAKQWDGRFHGF